MMDSLRQWAARVLNRSDIRRNRLLQFQRTHPIQHAPRRAPPASLAVVVPVYQHAAFLPAALASLAGQTRLPDEVILIIDASPDASRAVAERTVANWPLPLRTATRILENPTNLGQAASINRAVAATTSDLIMILNDDDALLPHAIQTTLTLYAQHPTLHLTGAHALHVQCDAELQARLTTPAAPLEARAVEVRTPDQLAHYRRGNDLNLTHSGSCFTRTAWQAVGGYQPDQRLRVIRFSDRDFQLRVAALFPVALLPTYPLSLWRSGSSVDAGRNS